jgi:FecR protein.
MPAIAAKPTSGKVRSVLGDVSRQKANKTNWAALRVGATVEQADKIRTEIESQAIINLPDGSTISIEEKTLVVFEELLSHEGNQQITADVQKGKVRFDVQKQKGKESSFKFRTGTATAAIRGTAGVIGQTSRGKPIRRPPRRQTRNHDRQRNRRHQRRRDSIPNVRFVRSPRTGLFGRP